MNYNPADYRAIQNEAYRMSKPELEEFYVKTKDKRYTSPLEGFFIFIFIISLLSFIGLIGYSFGSSHDAYKFEKTLNQLELDICPLIGENYESIELFPGWTNSDTVKLHLECNERNINP